MTSFYALMKDPRQWIWNFPELEFSNTFCTDITLWLDVTVINAVNLFFSNPPTIEIFQCMRYHEVSLCEHLDQV